MRRITLAAALVLSAACQPITGPILRFCPVNECQHIKLRVPVDRPVVAEP